MPDASSPRGSTADRAPPPQNYALQDLAFADLEGFGEDDHFEAFQVFARSSAAIVEDRPPLREGIAPSPALKAICRRALTEDVGDRARARRFFEAHFRPCRVLTQGSNGHKKGRDNTQSGAFLTGYYEPIVAGSLTPNADFTAPLLSRPDDLISPASGARAGAGDQSLAPYPDRAAIEAGAIAGHTAPLVWLRDPIEVFLIQVQGSARVRLPDGEILRLVYAGRNGQPYASIGRILIESGEIAEADMSLAALKQWVRDHGQQPFEAGAALMARNKSYVFFALDSELDPSAGPIGGAGLSLTPLRSIAIDRTIWPYGLPVWIAANIPWREPFAAPFRRLMIAQDTGSAITGPARADIFFGSGDDAGARAGDIRHAGDFVIFLPVEEGSNR
nr:MltA domain-containing protein [Methylocapsa aurea]